MTPTALLLSLALGCTSGDDGSTDRQGPGGGSDVGSDTGEGAVDGCHAEPLAADAARTGLLAFPYDDDGNQVDAWRAFRLAMDGSLSLEGPPLALGRATSGRGVFTPDGVVGVVSADGDLSSIWVEEGGVEAVTVADDSGPYAGALAMHPSGEVIVVADVNWPDNGGGLYLVDVGCETGALTGARRVLDGKGTAAVVRHPDDPDVYALFSKEVPGTASGTDVHLVDVGTEPVTVLASVDAFGDDEAIASDATFTFAGDYLLVGDTSEFSGVPTRVAVVQVDGLDLTARGTVDVSDPFSLIAAPWAGGGVLALDGYGNAARLLERTDDDDAPFALSGAVASPSLPGTAVGLARGPLRGAVLVTETSGLRHLQLAEDGSVEDRGMVLSGSGLAAIPGGIAVQP